jgi:hypothetical protein
MGAAGVRLAVAGSGDRAALHAAVWTAGREFIHRYTAAASYAGALDYVDGAVRAGEERGTWGPAGDTLAWSFTDHAGRATRSAALWKHWLELALAADWTRVTELAADHTLTVTDPRPDLGLLLAGADTFVTVRSDVWSADEEGLHGDDRYLPLADLDDAERAGHAGALRRCRCAMCTMLRPEPDVTAVMLDALTRPQTRASAAWYLVRAHRATAETLLAVLRSGDGAMADLVPTVERYAPRVADAWPVVLAALPDLAGGGRGLALYALAATYRDDADRDLLVREIRAALSGTDEATEAAAEIAGRIGRGVPGLATEVAAVLDRDISSGLRHNAVLGLVNLHLPPAPPPEPAVRARLEREAATDTEAGRLAQWLLTAFPAR